MKGLLVRVGADQSAGGGNWNSPVDSRTGRFVYTPIPEAKPNRAGLERYYEETVPRCLEFGVPFPNHLRHSRMHLDPDFEHLTYGDRGSKGKQIATSLGAGDILVFYSGLMDNLEKKLVYAIIGLFIVDLIDRAVDWPDSAAHRNAHTRRELAKDADDIIVVARAKGSGRLQRCVPIGEYRDRAYRVRKELLEAWGNISANDGYLQRSAVFPSLLNPGQFLDWWQSQNPVLAHNNA